MSPVALTMMIVTLGTIWGGLVLSVVLLRRHPETADDAEARAGDDDAG
ncbi:MAG: methionine/alanine import family NSS transporter small subunit [Stackebrandtia sp.]